MARPDLGAGPAFVGWLANGSTMSTHSDPLGCPQAPRTTKHGLEHLNPPGVISPRYHRLALQHRRKVTAECSDRRDITVISRTGRCAVGPHDETRISSTEPIPRRTHRSANFATYVSAKLPPHRLRADHHRSASEHSRVPGNASHRTEWAAWSNAGVSDRFWDVHIWTSNRRLALWGGAGVLAMVVATALLVSTRPGSPPALKPLVQATPPSSAETVEPKKRTTRSWCKSTCKHRRIAERRVQASSGHDASACSQTQDTCGSEGRAKRSVQPARPVNKTPPKKRFGYEE